MWLEDVVMEEMDADNGGNIITGLIDPSRRQAKPVKSEEEPPLEA